MKYKIALFSLIIIGITFIGSYLLLKNVVLILPKEVIKICNGGPSQDDKRKTELFYKTVKKINNKIVIAELLAKVGLNIGYDYLSNIIKNIIHSGNTEYTFRKTYETLGYLGRIDKRAINLLISEFNPQEDPTRAIDVLRALIISKNPEAVFKIKKLALQKLEGYLSTEEKNFLKNCRGLTF